MYSSSAMRPTLFLLLALVTCSAQAQECTQTMPAIMLDEETRAFEPSISAERLHAKLGGHTFPVTSAERISGFRVLILIDNSGSMEEESPRVHEHNALVGINRVLRDLLDHLPQGVSVKYGMFDSYAVFSNEFASDAKELQRSLPELTERLKHKGLKKTALYDALKEALAQFGQAQVGDSIVVVTDGQDNSSKIDARRLQEEASDRSIRLFTILLERELTYDDVGWGPVLDFAERTGGSVHRIHAMKASWINSKNSDAENKLRRFWNDEVLSGYLLRFNVPAAEKKHSKWLLSVDRLPGQKHRVVASYPSRLHPCPAAVAAK